MKKLFFVFAFMCLAIPAKAVTINVGDLSDRLDKIETAMKGLQKKLSNNYVGGAKQPSGQALPDDRLDGMLMRLQDVEQSTRQLTGDIESIRFTLDGLQEKIDRINSDNALRFADMEKKLKAAEDKVKKFESEKAAAENAQKAAEKKKKEQEAAAVKAAKEKEKELKDKYGNKKPKELYDDAFAAIKKQQYKVAQGRLEAFLSLYPKDALADNAQYWLGESFFARKMYPQAAVAFADGLKNYPDGAKAPDNLFKLGVTMSNLNKKDEACVAFKSFSQKYPNTMKKRLDEEVKKLQCP